MKLDISSDLGQLILVIAATLVGISGHMGGAAFLFLCAIAWIDD
jgi:hypothetical protein